MERKRVIMSAKTVLTTMLVAVLTVVCSVSMLSAQEPSIADYTAYPPFLGQVVPPNVLIVLDNSGSMSEFAYEAGFDPSDTYFGYFNTNSKYSYSTSAGGFFYQDPNGSWDGNFLNWLTMRRVDVVRRVLVGGKAINRANPTGAKYLVGFEGSFLNNFDKTVTSAGNYTPYSGDRCFSIDNNGSYAAIFVSSHSDGDCWDFDAGTYSVKVGIGLDEPLGVVQRTWDRIRFGLVFFNDGDKFEGGGSRDGGYVADWIVGPGANIDLITKIENTDPETMTPLGEAFYETTRYFRAGNGAYQPANYAAQDPIQEWCQRNFVLVLTDGESTTDQNIPGGCFGVPTVSDPDGFNVGTYMGMIATNEGAASQHCDSMGSSGTYYLEGVAYWAYTTDLRSDLEGIQNIITYTVFAFEESAAAEDLMQKTAKYGAFEDRNDNNEPDLQVEWDTDGDNIPDAFFKASHGSQLEGALLSAFSSILNRTSSGTSVSVISTTGAGEGALYQAYFYASKTAGYTEFKWLGHLHALFVDSYGNLREDTNENNRLDDTNTDYILWMWFDNTEKKVKVDRFIDNGDGVLDCIDTSGNGRLDTCDQDQRLDPPILFEEIHTIWEGGDLLFSRDPDTRKIYTTIDGSAFLESGGDPAGFVDSNRSTLRPYLRGEDDGEASNIINYIRGTDISGYRSRTMTIDGTTNTWKLGDIVYSSPTAVGRPSENFDFMFADSSYGTFRTKHNNRRHVVYVGANDGMLHAFNAGFYDAANHQFVDTTGHALGEELWAFIPRELLPHLKWLTEPNYTHVYYMDLKPRIADVRIFNVDAAHPGGWGTVLIGGMRYGGKAITTEVGTFRSTYFALDVTDPLNPRLLWTFTDTASPDDLGLTFSYPAMVRIKTDPSKKNSEDPGRWFVVFGSGPTAYDGSSDNTGRVYVLDISGGTHGVIPTWTVNTNYWKFSTGDGSAFMADAIAVDVDRDYAQDIAYIGDTYTSGANYRGKMFRLVTKGDTSPSNWAFSTLFDAGSPITAASSAAKDRKNNLWIYFGTGRYLDTMDVTEVDQQAFYGIKDTCQPWISANYLCTTTIARADLLDVSDAVVSAGGGTVTGVPGVTNWVSLLGTIDQKDGWFVNFPLAGERNYVKPLVLGGIVAWVTYLPSDDICSTEGDSFLYAVYYETGTAFTNYVFLEEWLSKPGIVGKSKYLGKGAPAALVGMVTKRGTMKGFAQTSTGAIKEFGFEPAESSYGSKGWKMGGIR